MRLEPAETLSRAELKSGNVEDEAGRGEVVVGTREWETPMVSPSQHTLCDRATRPNITRVSLRPLEVSSIY